MAVTVITCDFENLAVLVKQICCTQAMANIGVIGAGIIGLSSAVNIQRQIPGAKVTLIADNFGKDTTSDGAGGFFRPFLGHCSEQERPMVREWVKDSWNFFNGLARSPDAKESGNSLVSGTLAFTTPMDDNYATMAELTYDFHKLNAKEVQKLNFKYTHCYSCTTVITEPRKYMMWLMRKFREAGGTVEHRTVQKLSDLCGQYDVVVNCCGLGARELVGDSKIFPVRGQLVMVEAPWMKHFFFCEDDVYLIPHCDKLIIGGVRQKGNYSTTADLTTREFILSRAEELFPQLKGAKILSDWAGLRPARDEIRFETEMIDCGGKGKLSVVHNYGHGGHGISLSWGASVAAARKVQEVLRSSKSRL